MGALSVVVPHYGDAAPTRALLRQLLAQASDDVEIIVADDCSPEPFPEMDGVTVVRRSTNGGFGANVNSAAEVATGTNVLVLNSDLELGPDFLQEMKRAAERHPRSVLSPRVIAPDGHEAWTGRVFPRTSHHVAAWLTPLARWRHTPAWHRIVGHDLRSHTRECQVDWVVGAAMWIPLTDFRAVGGFDERFFMNSEEVDLQRRLSDRGVRAVALQSPTVVHEGGGSSPTDSRRRWLAQGQLTYADKWGSRRNLQTALAAATAVNFVVNAARRAAGRQVRPVEVARSELRLIRNAE